MMTDTGPIRAALYARVSTSNHGQDVTLQTRELKEFIEYRGPRIRQTVLLRAERDFPTVRAVAVR